MREPPLTLGFDDEPEDADEPRAAAAERRAGAAERRAGAVASSRPTTPIAGFIVRTDGAARGNPGPASAGAVLISLTRPDARDPRATPDASISDYLGIQTNNVAEYTAVVRAIALGLELGAERLELLLDSKLIVEQLAGRWRVKDLKLRPLWAEALRQLRTLARGWSASHVPRAQNSLADAMCNEAIDRALAGGPASVVVRPRG
jgi:ribonuclease HI